MRLKGLLVAELTTKTLRRHGKGSPEKKNKTDKDDMKENSAATDGKVMNILTADFATVTSVCSCLDAIYIQPFTLAIGIWYMYKLLGVSAFIGMIVAVAYIPLSKMMFVHFGKLTQWQSAASDKRIAAITELLQGIKAVKLFGWESRFLEKIDEKREEQLGYAWKVFLWSTGISASASINPILILVVIFTSYVVVFGNTLNAEVAFTSIAIFQMVQSVVRFLPGYINFGVSGYVALKRIDSYLKQPQVQDLEERTPEQTFGDELGFECADLEWNSADNANDVS
ncbi:hypothetical protein LPJ81_006245, partial [Coemansia sp. IMI 209127]